MNNTPRDYIFISREFPDRRNISIYYISDLHTGAKDCYQEQFEKFIDWIAKQENAYLVLGGDLMNNLLVRPCQMCSVRQCDLVSRSVGLLTSSRPCVTRYFVALREITK